MLWQAVSVARAATTKLPQAGWLKQRKSVFLTVLEAGYSRSGGEQGQNLRMPPSLACRWPSSPFVTTQSFPWACSYLCPNLLFL